MPPKVVIVILNWNGLADTLECLESIRRLAYANFAVLVVDNGSSSDEAGQLEKCDIVTRLVRSPVNLGYAGGANLGIRNALDMRADYVWLLNNDTIVGPDSLATLVVLGEEHDYIGLLSPVIYHYDARESVQVAVMEIDFRRNTLRFVRSIEESVVGPHGEGFALPGVALLVKRKVLEELGGFDERFFAYFEDTDFSVSALAAGFGTRLAKEARVYHKYGRSLGGRESSVREYLFTRNYYLFWTKHTTGRWRRVTLRFGYVAWVLECAVSERKAGRVVSAEHILAGGWDALRGRWGSWAHMGRLPRHLDRLLTRWVLDWHPYFWIALLRGDYHFIRRQTRARLGRGGDIV
jgi:GT2 family glycosyltransferase